MNAGSQVFGQDPLWLAWANDLINFKKAGDMAAYNNLLATVTPAHFKVGQMISATGLLLGITGHVPPWMPTSAKITNHVHFHRAGCVPHRCDQAAGVHVHVLRHAAVHEYTPSCGLCLYHSRYHPSAPASFGNLGFIPPARIPMSLQAGHRR